MKNVEDMTIAELKECAAKCCNEPSDVVLIRTYSAGVHFGELAKRNGQEVTLKNARRIWQWFGAKTLNEIANSGVDQEKSRISEAVPEITLLQAIEIIQVSKKAAANLYGAKWK